MMGTIDITDRPIKLAFLVNPNNKKHVREAIQICSTLWGGVFFPIIPLYKRVDRNLFRRLDKSKSIEDVILGYIDAFDPDLLIQIADSIPQYILDLKLNIIDHKDVWKDFDKNNFAPRGGIGIFELLNGIFDKYIKYKMKYPIEVILPILPKENALFWTSLFGEIPSILQSHLKSHYYDPLGIKTPKVELSIINELLSESMIFPRRITRYLLKVSKSGYGHDNYIFFMDTSKTNDVIDFWNLRATGKNVLPISMQLFTNSNYRELVIDFVKSSHKPSTYGQNIYDCVTIMKSRMCNKSDFDGFISSLKSDESIYGGKEPYFYIQEWYPRLWDKLFRGKDGVKQLIFYGTKEDSIELDESNISHIRFKPLLPNFAHKFCYTIEPRCANEISFRLYGSRDLLAEVFPFSSGFNYLRALDAYQNVFSKWRISHNGLVKLVRDDMVVTLDIPQSERIVFAWMEDYGWKSKLSKTGILAKQLYSIFGGFLNTLQDEKLLGFLEHMSGGNVTKEFQPKPEIIMNQPRTMKIGEVINRLGKIEENNLHKRLVNLNVFKIGLELSCPICMRNSWYPCDAISEQLYCPKCLSSFSALGNIDNSNWCYKTNGPFTVPNYAEGAYVVLLALNFFKNDHIGFLKLSPALSFDTENSEDKRIEIDLAFFWEGFVGGEKMRGLAFVECKTYGCFEQRDFDRMRYLAQSFPDSMIVFCTLRKTLSNKEVVELTKIAKYGRKMTNLEQPLNPVLILTGTELLNYGSPPYCWEGEVKEKFSQSNGLLDLCNATQQIYLNLEPWHDDWHKKIRKKIKLRGEKIKQST